MWNQEGGRTWSDLHATLDEVFQPLDDKVKAQADAAVLAAFAPYVDGDLVRFTSACWLATARA